MTHTNRFDGKGEIYAVEPNDDMHKKMYKGTGRAATQI